MPSKEQPARESLAGRLSSARRSHTSAAQITTFDALSTFLVRRKHIGVTSRHDHQNLLLLRGQPAVDPAAVTADRSS
jgi:hypothetical protein